VRTVSINWAMNHRTSKTSVNFNVTTRRYIPKHSELQFSIRTGHRTQSERTEIYTLWSSSWCSFYRSLSTAFCTVNSQVCIRYCFMSDEVSTKNLVCWLRRTDRGQVNYSRRPPQINNSLIHRKDTGEARGVPRLLLTKYWAVTGRSIHRRQMYSYLAGSTSFRENKTVKPTRYYYTQPRLRSAFDANFIPSQIIYIFSKHCSCRSRHFRRRI